MRLPTTHCLSSFIGILGVLLGMMLAVWLLTVPAIFRIYYPIIGASEHARDAESVVRWLSSNHRPRSLNLALTGGQLSEKELRHYSDVRRILRWLLRVAAALGLLAVGAWWAAGFHSSVLRRAQRYGLFFWGALFLIGLGWAIWDWKGLFASLHKPFFGSHSWRLRQDSYSLTLFPGPFWRVLALAVMMAPLALLIAAGLMPARVPASAHHSPTSTPRTDSGVREHG